MIERVWIVRTNSSKLAPHMDNHNDRHDQRENVHKIHGALEDDCVGQLNAAAIAVGLNAGLAADRARRSDEKA